MASTPIAVDHDEPVTLDRRSERRRAMIAAAEALFLENGYEATSLAAIVKRSGGSLATLYDLFGNKQGLLRAIIEVRKKHDLLPLCDGCPTETPATLLRRYAHQVYSHVTNPESVALMRIVVAEVMRDPDFAYQIYNDIHLPSVRRLADLFAVIDAHGDARIDDPNAAAALFFAIVMSDAQLRMMVGSRPGQMDESTLDWRLEPFIRHFQFRDH